MSGSVHVKQCIRCGEIKPLEAFYAHSKMRDGHLNACAECVKAGVQRNYRRNRDHYVAYDKQRETTDERKAFKFDAQRAHRARHPDKYRARNALNNAVRDGRISKQPCEDCGTTASLHAHHHDYSKPLDVHWLCKDCHWKRHGGVRKSA